MSISVQTQNKTFGRYTTFYWLAVDPQTGKRSFELLPVSPGGIVHSQAMPGFQFRVRDLYRMPPMEALVEDEVYRGYVWLSYQAQKQRAEMAEVRAERAEERIAQERTRAEEATALAKKYEAMLRQLGMLSDEAQSSA